MGDQNITFIAGKLTLEEVAACAELQGLPHPGQHQPMSWDLLLQQGGGELSAGHWALSKEERKA